MKWPAPLLCLILLASFRFPGSAQVPPALSVDGKGVQTRVPAGWTSNPALVKAGGPIAMTNFQGVYLQGGLLPEGGAEIEITSVPRPIELAGYARSELRGVQQVKIEELSNKGKPTLRVRYTEQPADGVSTENVVYYIGQGQRLYSSIRLSGRATLTSASCWKPLRGSSATRF